MTVYHALGLMSGTSMDGVDAALLHSDGETIEQFGPALSVPYPEGLRQSLQHKAADPETELGMTQFHAEVVNTLLKTANMKASDVDLIGFHGHTIGHRPDKGWTKQIGDGPLLAKLTNIDVMYQLRQQDVQHGGQGAPLVPVYHQALFAQHEKPVAIINIGGVSNITWIGPDQLLAFDTGPGNAQLDDWISSKSDAHYDVDGTISRKGALDKSLIDRICADHLYFHDTPPKSLDRNQLSLSYTLESLSLEDGAAHLAYFTACAIAKAEQHLPNRPHHYYICGGGRHNPTIMAHLSGLLSAPVSSISAQGLDGDATEAQAFAYLAIRAKLGLPLTFPSTTGVEAPQSGGVFCPAKIDK